MGHHGLEAMNAKEIGKCLGIESNIHIASHCSHSCSFAANSRKFSLIHFPLLPASCSSAANSRKFSLIHFPLLPTPCSSAANSRKFSPIHFPLLPASCSSAANSRKFSPIHFPLLPASCSFAASIALNRLPLIHLWRVFSFYCFVQKYCTFLTFAILLALLPICYSAATIDATC